MNSRVVALADYRGTPRLRSAMEAFFSDKQLSANTRRAYRQALSAVAEDLGVDLPVDQMDPRHVLEVFSATVGVGTARHLEHPDHRPPVLRVLLSTQQVDKPRPDDTGSTPPGTPRPDQSHPLPRPGKTLVPKRHQTCEKKLLWRMLYETAARAGEILALNIEDHGPSPQTSSNHWQRRPQRIRILGIRLRRGCCQGIWLDDAEGRRSSPTGDPTSSLHEETNAHTPVGEDFPTNAPPPYSNRQVVGGHSTNSATPHSLTSARAGASTTLLQAKSRHQDPRTLAIYTKPGNEAIAQLTSAFDKQRWSR